MASTITFILPSLFSKHCCDYLTQSVDTSLGSLEAMLKKSKKTAVPSVSSIIHTQFDIPHTDLNIFNSAQLMARGEKVEGSGYWLRADPVMLSATHNGILCRGNRVLNLSDDETRAIEILVNNYLLDCNKETNQDDFVAQPMAFTLQSRNHGYLHFKHPTQSIFSNLGSVIGQDISARLPKGDDEAQWHSLMNDFQMLLHNCDVNQARAEQGLPTINGIWLWAETVVDSEQLNLKNVTLSSPTHFTDSSSLLALNPNVNDINELTEDEESPFHTKLGNQTSDFKKLFNQKSYCIYIDEFEQAAFQNDFEGFQALYTRWVDGWLLPSLRAVKMNQLKSVVLITGDGSSYQFGRNSEMCFWRNHQLIK